MSLTIVNRTDTFEAWRTKTNTISTQVGDIALLDAGITADTNLTDAVNELQGDIGTAALVNFTATTLRGAANEIRNDSITLGGNKTLSGNTTLGGTLTLGASSNVAVNTDKFTIAASSGNTSIQGVLGVQGVTSLASSLGVTGATTLSTVSTSGLATLASASVTGALDVGGNTTLGNATVDTTLVTGSLSVKGADFKVQTSAAVDKFTVDDATGDTLIKGNLTVEGTTTISGATTFSANFNTLNNKPSPIINVSLSGDITGSGSVTIADAGSVSPSFTQQTYSLNITNTAIQANSIALGTDTTGNYIATAAAGSGVTVSGSGSEDAAITITNSDRGSSQNIFKNFAVTGQSTVVADSNDDTVTLVAGSNIEITTNSSTDTITITSTTAPGNNGQITVTGSSGLSGSGTFGVNDAGATTIALTNSDRGTSQNIFKTVTVTGQSTITAASNTDALAFAAASLDGIVGIVVTTDSSTKTVSIAHANTSGTASVNNSNGNVIQDITLDTYGHITGVVSTDLDSRYLQVESDTLATITARAGGATANSAAISVGSLTTQTTATIGTNLVVGGNLTVNGTTTTVNSTTLDITDLNINIAKDAVTAAAANGAGFTIGTYASNPTLLYVNASNSFVLNRGVEATSFSGPLTGAVTGNVTGNVIGSVTGNVTGNVTGSSGSCTGNAATITSQANSATIGAVSANTANQIVLRDASGNFSAGTITATLTGSISGNAATVSSISGNSVSSGQITTGLGFTPYNATNPSGYTTNVGTVTSVTGSAPVVSSGGTTPAISMAAASSGVPGYMTGAYASKLDGIASGATNVTNTNQLTNGAGYTTNVGTVTSVATSGNVSGITLTGSVTTSGTLTLGGAIGTLNQNTTGTASNITAYTINQSVGTGNSPTFAAVTAGSFNATSSLRYKDNVVTLSGASNLVKQLRGVSYDRKDGSVKNDVGVIAEEVQQLIPAIVGLNSEGMADSVDYGRLSAVLIEAVKDILARLEKLESK